MRRVTNMVVSLPTLVVALVSLVQNESVFSFGRKVGMTWIFFSILAAVLRMMWRMSKPAAVPEPGRRQRQGVATAEDETPESQTGEPETVKEAETLAT